MKKVLLTLFIFCFVSLSTYAENFPNLPYKNINNKEKISYDAQTDLWSKRINKNDTYYIKTKGFGEFSDYIDSNKNFAFSTNCEYEFIYKNSLIGYSNKDLKFYQFSFINGELIKTPLAKEEVQNIFPTYRVISLADFSEKTNAYKIKKHFGALDVILLNESDKTYENYDYSSGNAKFNQYKLKGFLTITKPGMIQFAESDTSLSDNMWYMLLVR